MYIQKNNNLYKINYYEKECIYNIGINGNFSSF